MNLRIIYQDDAVVVAYKPAGLATQTAKVGQPDLVSELKKELKTRYLGVIHRLDQPVEGLLVFARTQQAAGKLSGQLSGGSLNKQYFAAICGKPPAKKGQLVDYLIKTKDNRAEVVTGRAKQYADAKKAVLEYKIVEEVVAPGMIMSSGESVPDIATGAVFYLADICIETGRFHQIRCQMAHAGMPLLGDMKYGAGQKTETELSAKSTMPTVRNVALCAYKLVFVHPVTGRKMSFEIKPENPVFDLFTGNNFGCDCLY